MAAFENDLEKLAVDLFDINAVKFGSFMTKIGIMTPVYFDFRVIVSYPRVLEDIANLLQETFVSTSKCDSVCGVPYTALPIATVVSVKNKIPMLMRRKETKDYGTKKTIEGSYKSGDKCLIIEDVVTSGSSILETVNDLRNEGLDVTEALVLLDREQGGVNILKGRGIEVRALFTVNKFIDILVKLKKIEGSVAEHVRAYIKGCQLNAKDIKPPQNRLTTPYSDRAQLTRNSIAKQLYEIMTTKQSNLCLAADLTTSLAILNLAEKVGPHICILKLHADILEDFSESFVNSLKSLAAKHNFLLMEDRKFADIGNTVSLQYSKGPFRIVEWADLITAHSLPGEGLLKGIKSVVQGRARGVFLLAEMSSEGNLITPHYIEETNKQAEKYGDLVVGFVCQSKDTLRSPHLLQLTPGVQLSGAGDDLGQIYNSPKDVIIGKGADIAVVGRGIINATSPETEAQLYRETLWKHYEDRLLL